MKFLFFIFLGCAIILPGTGFSQIPDYDDAVVKSNRIMKNIYNEIWKIRNNYDELKDFGPDNYSGTPELPIQYQKIKSIRVRGVIDNDRATAFRSERFRGEKDILYICFSDKSKAFGTLTRPFFGVFINELGLYILIYVNIDNNYFKHDIKNIVERNAVVVEQTSY